MYSVRQFHTSTHLFWLHSSGVNVLRRTPFAQDTRLHDKLLISPALVESRSDPNRLFFLSLSFTLFIPTMSSDEDVLDNEFTGFGRRVNGTCKDEESNCGPTNRGQSACCPRGMFCSGDSNTVCCPTDDDCTEALLETPRCADQSWKMYNNSAPFCCSEDSVAAFKTGQDSNICADGGFQALQDDETLSEKDQDDDRGAAEC